MLAEEKNIEYAALYQRFRAAAPDFGFRDDVVGNESQFAALFQLLRDGPPVPVVGVLQNLAAATNQVCEIRTSPTNRLGTGFLVGPDLVVTASHVVPGDTFTNIECAFNNLAFGTGQVQDNGPTVAGIKKLEDRSDLALGQPVKLNALDFRVFRLDKVVGDPTRKFITIDPQTTIAKDNSVYVIEYFEGTKSVTFSGGSVPRIFNEKTDFVFVHNVRTSDGASGAPVFNNAFEIVGLHRGKVNGSVDNSDNEAVAITRIYKQMHDQGLLPVTPQS